MRPDTIHGITLSPDGKRIAIGIGANTGVTDSISVIEVERMGEPGSERRIKLATATAERIVTRLHWANNSHLIAHLVYGFKQQGKDGVAGAEAEPQPGREPLIHSIDAIGNSPIVPLDRALALARIESEPRPDQDFVFISTGSFTPTGIMGGRHLYRVDLKTGDGRLVEEGDPVTTHWRVRDGRAVLKFNSGRHGEIANIFERADAAGDWTYVNSLRFPEDRWNHLHVIGHGISPTEDFMRMTRDGADTDGIHVRDLRTRKIVATLAELPDHDITDALIIRGVHVAASYVDDRLLQIFVDPALQKHYEGLLGYFGADASVRTIAADDTRNRLLLHVSGPQNPGEYFVYDVAKRHVELVAVERPWLDPTRLAPVTARDIRTRDGTEIKAYLTCPAANSDAPRPLVVMPPTGPLTLASIRFHAFAQAFAAEGWCVAEPNYRGTYGRGRHFQEAGNGQWTNRVAHDIVDTVKDLIAAGIADRNQVAAFAEGLGGHALLAGAAANPELFHGIVAFAVVADAKKILDSKERMFGKEANTVEQWRQWLGDMPKRKEGRLLDQVGLIRCPILLVHPVGYFEVPIEHSKDLQEALTRAGRPPQVYWQPWDPAGEADSRNAIAQLEAALGFLRPLLQNAAVQPSE